LLLFSFLVIFAPLRFFLRSFHLLRVFVVQLGEQIALGADHEGRGEELQDQPLPGGEDAEPAAAGDMPPVVS
jgi:hypothetical protein